MMRLLLTTFTLVAPIPPYPPAVPTLRDEDDHPIWATAKVSGAEFVISENSRHYPPALADGRHVREGIEYLSGRSFLAMLAG
jgi:hypothetical protein